jgi:hypothetical protein
MTTAVSKSYCTPSLGSEAIQQLRLVAEVRFTQLAKLYLFMWPVVVAPDTDYCFDARCVHLLVA